MVVVVGGDKWEAIIKRVDCFLLFRPETFAELDVMSADIFL